MENEKNIIMKEAVQIELNMCDLYLLYKDLFPEDREFWKKIAKEEKEHASILDLLLELPDLMPTDLLYFNKGDMKNLNKKIKEAKDQYKDTPPTKQEAYQFAIDLENAAFELHYQKLMDKEPCTNTVSTLQKLNHGDKDHADRIQTLLTVEFRTLPIPESE